MATTTTFMNLTTWPSPTDMFDHTQLADNFVALDAHDHSSGKGVPIPTAGLADASVSGSKLAPSAVGHYRTLFGGTASITTNQFQTVWLLTAGGTPVNTGAAVAAAVLVTFPLAPTDYALTGRTTEMRVATSLAVNATAPNASYTVGLYPITTAAGGSGALSVTAGTVVTGSTAVHTLPASGARSSAFSSDFVPPSSGVYALGFVPSQAAPAATFIVMSVFLQLRHV